MIIKALHTFAGILDLSSLERLQESNPIESYPFHLYIRAGDIVQVDDKFFTLTSIQNAIKLGYVEVGNISNDSSYNTSLIDPSFNGITITHVAGESLTAGELVYYKDDGKIYRAKADSTNTMICVGLATTNVLANSPSPILLSGYMRNSNVFNFITGAQVSKTNATVYVSNLTAGKATQTRPITSSHLVQIIGYAASNDVLSFSPDYTFIELS